MQKQQAFLNKILKENNFCFDKQKSIKCLAILYLDKVTTEDIDKKFQNVCQAFAVSCKNFDSATVQIQAAAWPFVCRELFQSMKQYLDDGSVQVIQKDKNNYLVVGYINEVEKNAALLRDLSSKCVVEKIENLELFEILQMEIVLLQKNELVEIHVQRKLHQMVIRGEKENVKKCIQYYHRISNLDELPSEIRQISEHVHKFLLLRRVRQGVYDLLKRNGFRLYWRTLETDSSFMLEGFGFMKQKVAEAVEFLTKEGIKETRIARSDLQAGKLNVQKENAQVFEEEDGDLVLVCYGNIVSQVVAKDSGEIHSNIFTGTYQLRSEQAELFQRKVVHDFIIAKLQRLPFTGNWSLDVTQQKMIIYCVKKEEADGLLAAFQDLFYTVQIDVNSSNEHIKQFMSKHQERAVIGKGDGEDCSVISVTEDIKEELDSLLKEMARNPGVSKRQQKKIYLKNVFPLNAEILNHLKENPTDKLATVSESCAVKIAFTQGGLLLESESAEAISNAKKQLFDIVKNIAHKKEIIKIRGDVSYGTVRKEIERGEESGQCSVSLFGSEVEEPQYYKSWNNHFMNVVIAEGDIENSVSDVLVCLIDENFEPVGRSAERIFKKGW